jgi:transposase-like protein
MSDFVPPPRSRQATRQLWVDRLARFPGSGLSVAAFCATEGVSPNSFFYWKRQLATSTRALDAEPCFLPVRVTPATAVEVALPSGAVVRISSGCDLAFVRSLIDSLTEPLC